ncbi:isopentenyl-diphosphate delta-isomerase (macronuclear) [Tetrahymena thermophila SB210]|uniref:isopentenyl-diphosphate Delta-isomerase n=1 Tax=Tetrahymena thermophila (strain SB210) TaxID=312017 RepID=I7M8B1_TETTS|nr:isopentenyl-diphosphate delta-isomerase [Tetrahymena thermophila SB210]EAR97538.1 isopentenyl-diphosphate delta-isomerase [Tetrahymena thermophila SB210]|eukprot:XP_001017783.1 isopentenyl-diphosphate delta-isomerase [Tetrahymena thermophila SB210]
MINSLIKRAQLKYMFSTTSKSASQAMHQSQEQTLSQKLILVNYQDDVVGQIDKKKAHLNEYIFSQEAKPHRAFSIFLFNDKSQLLLQKRSQIKITFPNHWTNTCCSHPLDQFDERDQHEGTKLAAQRRLDFEFNIKIDKLTDLTLVDKLLYKSASDKVWGEYELDYIFFMRKNLSEISPNPEEIEEYEWIDLKNLEEFLKHKESLGQKTTPWFRKIIDNRLSKWWKDYENGLIKDKRFTNEDNKQIPFF